MPPPLPQPPALNSTVEITKYLRSRDAPLPSLLSFAEKVLRDNKVFFPRKEEWLLEWLVQRLGEKDDGSAAARCNPKFWGMLLKLLRASSHNSVTTILKKHSFLQAVGKTLSEGKALPATVAGDGLEDDENATDIDGGESYHTPREEPTSVESSVTEEGFSVADEKVEASLLRLLPGVYNVLSWLQEQSSSGVGRDSRVVAVLRGTPEFGAQILGSYFEACLVLLEAGKTVSEEWTRSILNVWKSCIWGNPNSKKASSLSSVFSATCLTPLNNLLAFQPPHPTLQPYLEELLLEFIFTPEIIFPRIPGKPSKASSKELTALLEPLKSQTNGRIQLFRLAIVPQPRRNKPDMETVETLVQAVIPLSYARTSPGIFTDLLELLVEHDINLPSETLSLIVDEASGLASGRVRDVRWRLIDLALKLDFDIFLGGNNQRRRGNLIHAIGHASDGNNDQILKTLEALIESYAKARNLGGFIEMWAKELQSRAALWESDAVAKMVGDRLEKNLSAFQIERIFKEACEAGSDLNWVLIDALLRGVRTDATEAKIKKYLPKVVDTAETSTSGWRRWRVLLRVIQIDNTAVDQGFIQRVKPSAKEDVDPRETLFFKEFQIALSGSNGVSPPEDALAIALPSTSSAPWTGSVNDISNRNLCLALNTGYVNNWLESIEHIGSLPAKEEFIDRFLDSTLHSKDNEKSLITARDLWLGMLANGEFFELPTLKDIVMAALIRGLRPFSDMHCTSQSLAETTKHRQETDDHTTQQYIFVIDSIAHYPPEAIKRATRERVLDTLVLLSSSLTSTSSRLSSELDSKILQIMDKLWTLGNASSFLATDSAALVEWTSRQGGDIARKILRHSFSTKEQERSQGFLANVVRVADQAPLSVVENSRRAAVIIEEFWKASEEDAVRGLKDKLMISLEKFLAEPEGDSGTLPDVNFLQVWRKCWTLERGGPGGCQTATELARHVIHSTMRHGLSDFLCDRAPAEGNEILEVVREASVLFCASSETPEQAIETTALVISVLGSKFTESVGFNSVGNHMPKDECRQELITAFKEMAERLQQDAFEKCLVAIADGYLLDTLEDPASGPKYREVLKALIKSIKKSENEPAKKRMAICASKTFSKLSRNLHKMPTEEDFLTVAACMETILHEKPWVIHQSNIDESLTAVTLSTSPSSGPHFTTTNPDEVYLGLCNLTRTVLTLHRRRIRGGRYHLVITALQSLLRCIIKRKPACLRKKSDKIVHPPWLLPAHSPTPTQLPPGITQAGVSEGFNRLVGTLCEPSVGSVRPRHAGATAGIDSEREREKREVAGCVGGLLGEVLKGGLAGGFEGDVSIGIGKVFQVLGGEGVKVFAYGLDREGRAMLRGMWEEFKKGDGGEIW